MGSLCSTIATNGTTSAQSNSNTTSPNADSGSGSGYGSGSGSNATSTEPALPTLTSQPYTGRASAEQVAKPSLIALVALFAVAILLL